MAIDTDRFESLYREMVPAVHRFAATRLGNADAQDLVSDVFHAAAVAYTDGRISQVTPAWIMTVARNKVIDRWRTAERRSAIALRYRGRPEDHVDFPPDWSQNPRRESVLAALDQMRPSDRRVIVLHYLDGMTIAAMADALGCSESAMASRLSRARSVFKEHFRPEVTS